MPGAPIASYHRWSAYSEASVRPATSTSAIPTSVMSAQRRPITSDRDSLRAQPGLHHSADLREPAGCAGLETQDEHRLRVGCADEAPPSAEEHTNPVDVDDVVRRPEMGHRALDDAELDLVGAIDANLRGRDELRNVGQQFGDALPRVGNDSQQPSGTIHRVIRSEEHTSELQSPCNLVCRLLLEKKKQKSTAA